MLLIYSEIAGLVDRGWVVDMVMLDFPKAFDVVSYVVLLDKLREIGVCTVLLNWICFFFVKSQNVCRCRRSIQQCQKCGQ